LVLPLRQLGGRKFAGEHSADTLAAPPKLPRRKLLVCRAPSSVALEESRQRDEEGPISLVLELLRGNQTIVETHPRANRLTP